MDFVHSKKELKLTIKHLLILIKRKLKRLYLISFVLNLIKISFINSLKNKSIQKLYIKKKDRIKN
ncbi:hypothetical protein CWO85_00465 [Candidatus Phytoplasma ziziphi]|uniref:Uncharacterized protein n=1 Tax=Ziziphus jujuba witches'-broom phytoplasma TaxID=135727 RepID=A0A660HLU5_ZIZJU|nr:hypothetical protein CWO85_00465 [Candidatus Phytoplasma ziziphi]